MPTDGEQPKVDLIHQDPAHPNLVTDYDTAHAMANATQKGFLAAERIEKEAGEKDKLKLLGDKLIEGVLAPQSYYTKPNEIDRVNQTPGILKKRIDLIKEKFDEVKLINRGKSDLEIIQEIVTEDDNPLNILKITDIVGTNGVARDSLYGADLIGVAKSLGTIPEDTPNGRGKFPRNQENDYFFKLLQVDGEITAEKTDGVTSNFTKPTSIEGVNLIIGFRSDTVGLPKNGYDRYSNATGDPWSTTTKIELTPQFIAKAIGVSAETTK